ncbi:MAG: CoA-binding protein, partial [Alphaproteobacteria bacterium]
MTHPLEPMLRPNSVAIIGASNTASRIGGRPINSMKTLGYKGDIYPVNPNYETIQDLPAYASMQDVPQGIDCAVIAVPAKIAVQALKDCVDRGVKSAVMFTSGFAELDASGAKAQLEISGIARESGMRIIGPNCLGVFNVDAAWYGTFTNAPGMLKVPSGPIGIVSQSGAYGAHVFMVSQLRGVGSNYWVTTGNESDVDVAEVIEYYAQAPDVKVILAYAEGMKNRDRICQALEMARDAKKPVIFMKVGKTDVGAIAAASHTASLAGADAVYDALFKQYGVYRADTTEELVDVAYGCQFGKFPRGNKVDLQTISGGVGVQMADASVKYGLEVTPLPAATQKKLKELIPFAGVNNPVDFTAMALNDPTLMEKNISLTVDEADFDSHIIYLASRL